MITASKEFSWAMAHILEGHDGLCKNLHGHNYRMIVTIMSYDGQTKTDLTSSDRGMVIDFKKLKECVNSVIINKLDHAFVYNQNDKDSLAIALYLKKTINQKLYPFCFRTTAENMVEWIADELQDFFDACKYKIFISRVQLYETETSYAEWKNERKIMSRTKKKYL